MSERDGPLRSYGILIMVDGLPLSGFRGLSTRRSIGLDNSFGEQIEDSLAGYGLISGKEIIESVILADDHDDMANRAPGCISVDTQRIQASNQHYQCGRHVIEFHSARRVHEISERNPQHCDDQIS